MNKVIEYGRMTSDPEIKYSKGEKSTAIANFSIAVNRKFKREGQPDADFFNCTCFGKTAEIIEKYFHKGSRILVSGSLQNDTYEKDGQKRTTTKIIVEEVDFVDSKNCSSEPAEAKDASGNPYPKFDGNDGFMNAVDPTLDPELPFA